MEISYINPVKFIVSSSGYEEYAIKNVLELLDGGATIPFIARYRKERTGNMDEVKIDSIQTLYRQWQELEKRKSVILETIVGQGKLTPELERQIRDCVELRQLEDIYLPYKPKKQTRASKAKANGLEPLAAILMKQNCADIDALAGKFLSDHVENVETALQGARDIISEWINESESARNHIRRLIECSALISSKVIKGKDEEGIKYKDYYDFQESLKRCPSHRILAILRGASDGVLRVGLQIEESEALRNLERIFIKRENDSAEQVRIAIKDAYKRLLFPSIESEYMAISKQKADKKAISVFSENLRQLLLASPLGNKRVLGIDPGFRTGCKVVCLDTAGQLLYNETIYPHPPKAEIKQAAAKIRNLVSVYKIEAIAIGNGTAGRETKDFIDRLRLDSHIQVFSVNENGASVYSASKIARDEFPEYDITVRGAVSIARRLMDPLAELIKIDPKSIGVGQYQHDVDQVQLKEALDKVVEYCVNSVGVNVNTASKYLLMHISGLGPALAENIETYIHENGILKNRQELKKVKRMGDKTFEQCAGFLRIENGTNVLDNSSVHPESYYVVEKMAKDLKVDVRKLIGNESLCSKIDIKRYVDDKVGMLTLQDIVQELKKPGRDPRLKISNIAFAEGIHTIEDLQEGMILPGIVTNLTTFGAFIDVGVHQDGLLHISEMSNRFITDPTEVLSLNQQIMVKVIQVDKLRKRISLSIKQLE